MSQQVRKEIEEFTRGLLEGRLAKITPMQLEFFKKIFPGKVPEDKLISAIDLCDRTINKNTLDTSRVAGEKQ